MKTENNGDELKSLGKLIFTLFSFKIMFLQTIFFS